MDDDVYRPDLESAVDPELDQAEEIDADDTSIQAADLGIDPEKPTQNRKYSRTRKLKVNGFGGSVQGDPLSDRENAGQAAPGGDDGLGSPLEDRMQTQEVRNRRSSSSRRRSVLAHREPRARKDKIARRVKSEKSESQQRQLRMYAVRSGGIPNLRPGSAGLRILEAIEKRGWATAQDLRDDLGPKFVDSTLRFFLGKFQRDEVIKIK